MVINCRESSQSYSKTSRILSWKCNVLKMCLKNPQWNIALVLFLEGFVISSDVIVFLYTLFLLFTVTLYRRYGFYTVQIIFSRGWEVNISNKKNKLHIICIYLYVSVRICIHTIHICILKKIFVENWSVIILILRSWIFNSTM